MDGKGAEEMTQKFHRGDLVHVAKDLGPAMQHFTADVDAIVIGSYNDQFGGHNTKDYSLYLKNHGKVSWYEEWQLTLIKKDQQALLEQWREDARKNRKQKSDLDWIFAHGKEIAKGNNVHGATITALGRCLGITNLWGSHGEGMTWYINAAKILSHAEEFLETEDKEGWLRYAEEMRRKLGAQE
jgi:hypothetical protein